MLRALHRPKPAKMNASEAHAHFLDALAPPRVPPSSVCWIIQFVSYFALEDAHSRHETFQRRNVTRKKYVLFPNIRHTCDLYSFGCILDRSIAIHILKIASSFYSSFPLGAVIEISILQMICMTHEQSHSLAVCSAKVSLRGKAEHDAEVYIRYFPSDRTFARHTERTREDENGNGNRGNCGKATSLASLSAARDAKWRSHWIPWDKGSGRARRHTGICFTIELESLWIRPTGEG